MTISESASEEILATYNLCIVGPRGSWESDLPESLPEWLREAEENITDLLPAGYRVVIREWDSDIPEVKGSANE